MTAERNWYIAIVANNTEMTSAEILSRAYEVYLPTQQVVSVWKDGRRKLRTQILLPGKLLIRCTEKERLETCTFSFVKRYMVDIASQKDEFGKRKVAIVPDSQVERLKFVLGQSETKVTIDNANLHAGERVRVIRGVFCGLEGIVSDWFANTTKLHITIEHLGCATMEVSIGDIERI